MKKESRKIVFVILAVIGFITVLVGSYAFISVNLTGTKKQVITAGSLQLELEEKEGITLTDALPVFDEVGMLGEPYIFTLRNSSNFLMKYELALVDETKGEELLAYEDLRYGLTKDGVTTYGSIAELENMIIDAGNIGAKTEINYQFRMWINHEVTDDTRLNGKSRTFKININAATSDDDIILAATLDGEAVAEFPTREDNYGVESIKCTDDLSASFDPITWSVTVDGITKSNTSCVVNFSSEITIDETDEAITMSKSELYEFYKGNLNAGNKLLSVMYGYTVSSGYLGTGRHTQQIFNDEYLSYNSGKYTVLNDVDVTVITSLETHSDVGSYYGYSEIRVNDLAISTKLSSNSYNYTMGTVELSLKKGDTIGVYHTQTNSYAVQGSMIIAAK